jgi:hypothetical protein
VSVESGLFASRGSLERIGAEVFQDQSRDATLNSVPDVVGHGSDFVRRAWIGGLDLRRGIVIGTPCAVQHPLHGIADRVAVECGHAAGLLDGRTSEVLTGGLPIASMQSAQRRSAGCWVSGDGSCPQSHTQPM